MSDSGCEYCRGEKPLTDKTYDDGSKFDDAQGTHIEKFGTGYMLVSYIKSKYFDFCKTLTPSQREFLPQRWAVRIDYCPKCGKDLSAPYLPK